MEKDVISKGLSESDLADSSEFGVNDAGTCGKGDAPLTQPCSLDVHDIHKSLALIRGVHGADTPLGHRCSNLIEQLKNYERGTGDRWAIQQNMAKSLADLARLSSAVTPNAEERG